MDASVMASLRRMDADRGDWWLVRMDTWPRGRWEISCDPTLGWDWRWKVGSSKCRAVKRLQRTKELQIGEMLRAQKLKQLRAIVDKMHP